MKLPEFIIQALLPLLGQWADKTIPEPTKRLLYLNICALGTEGVAWLKKTQTTLDEAAFDVLHAEAKNEVFECGLFHESTFKALDEFVSFKAE
ncbi:MAG: hypothetical protein IPK72_21090 [Candidatus Eisenbacteria bacterium]|nr:hypothetical protein [Candidatus Eisenbacteria bacterium]